MSTPKEILLETLKPDGKPERILNQYEAFGLVTSDPIMRYTRGNRMRGTTTKDRWGTTIAWPEDQVAAMPHITETDKVLPDITRWRDFVKVPDLAANCTDWTDALSDAAAIREKGEQLVMAFMATGVFDQCHYLMGFEDTLMNLLLEPDYMHELIEVIGDYRLAYAKLLVENLRPDVIISHDDWGSKNSLFMKPDDWREFYKPQYKKIYGYLKEQGVIILHHADSFCEPIIQDMVDVGIDVWQGVLPTNDIPRMQKELKGSMTLMGGIDSVIDRPDSAEDEIRAEVRRALETYAPGGNFIPSMTYGLPNTIYPHTDPAVSDEIMRYNATLFREKA